MSIIVGMLVGALCIFVGAGLAFLRLRTRIREESRRSGEGKVVRDRQTLSFDLSTGDRERPCEVASQLQGIQASDLESAAVQERLAAAAYERTREISRSLASEAGLSGPCLAGPSWEELSELERRPFLEASAAVSSYV